jgi:hypothetical protein
MKRTILLLAAACLAVAVPAVAQDNVEGPWGTQNADNFGRQRTTTPAGDWSGGIELDWELDVRGLGLDRVTGRNPITFDAAGNIYWITSIGTADSKQYVCSVAPDGSLRWQSNVAITEDSSGGFTTSGQVVGHEYVYAVGAGTVYNYDGDGNAGHLAAAFDKVTGIAFWQTDLDGDWNNDGTVDDSIAPDAYGPLSPVLFNGKLYVVLIGAHGTGVVQLDAATGNVDWYSAVHGATYSSAGSVVHVPGIFDGDDGLFFNLDDGSGYPANNDVFGLSIDPTPVTGGASLQWVAGGGNRARSHLIYSSETGYLYALTWWDNEIVPGEGGTGYTVYDPLDGTIIETLRTGNFGFYDVCGLDFNNTSVIGGSFTGFVLSHDDLDSDGTMDRLRMCKAQNWYGEHRVYGCLAQHEGDTLLITGTVSRANTGGSDYSARVVIYNLSDCLAEPTLVEDGPMYVDDIELYYGTDYADAIANPPVYTEDFEGMPLGDVSDDPDWTNTSWYDPNSADPGPPQVVDDPTGGGQGQVMMLDALGNADNNMSGANVDTPDVGGGETGFVVLRFKQWRYDLTDNDGAGPDTQLGTFQWDLTERIYIPWDMSYLLLEEYWHSVEVRYDFRFPDDYVELWVDGNVGEGTAPYMDDPNLPITSLDFNMWPTPPVTYPTPRATPVAVYDTGVEPMHYEVRGGPVLGPDGKIYYFKSDDGKLVALKRASVCGGDVDGDGDTDLGDLQALLAAYGSHTGDPNYNANADFDSDGDVDLGDLQFLLSDYGCSG